MPTVDVLIFVEHLARELEAVCLIKHFLEEKHGLSVRIASSPYESHELLSRICPRVVCVPSVREHANTPVAYWWEGLPIVSLSWEQILSNVNKQANTPRDEFTRTQVHYLAWGPAFQDFLTQGGVPREKIMLAGCPNFTLLDERYRFLCRDRSRLGQDHGLQADKPWVFIPENYGWAFISDGQIEARVKSGAYKRDNALAYRDYQRRNLKTMLNWVRVAATRSDVELIVRPRPSTPLSSFIEAFGADLPAGISILKEGTAREWLLAADVVVSNYSTVLVDAAVAGKPVFQLQAESVPELLQAEFLNYLPTVESPDEFVEICRQAPSAAANGQALCDYALRSFHVSGDAFERSADWLAGLRRSCTSLPKYLHGRGWYRFDRSWRRFIPFDIRLGLSRLLGGATALLPEAGKRPFVAQTFADDRFASEQLDAMEARVGLGMGGEIAAALERV